MNNEQLTQILGNEIYHYPCLKIYKHPMGDTMVLFSRLNYGTCVYSSHPGNLFVGGHSEFRESEFETFDGELTLSNLVK